MTMLDSQLMLDSQPFVPEDRKNASVVSSAPFSQSTFPQTPSAPPAESSPAEFLNPTSVTVPSDSFPSDELFPPEPFKSQEEPSADAAQTELFETNPPPWELAVEDDVLLASIVFSKSPHGPYDYRIPDSLREDLKPGMRVGVPLGHRKKSTLGWCVAVKEGSAAHRKLRDVAELLDDTPLCDAALVRLVMWMGHYYQVPAGQVFDTLIPSSVRAGAGTRQTTYFTPAKDLTDEQISKLPAKQQAVVRLLISSGKPTTAAELAVAVGCTEDPIRRLRKKEILIPEVRREMHSNIRILAQHNDGERKQKLELTEQQQAALERINTAVDSGRGRTLLLHGVTGSGKTEVYIKAIEHVVSQAGSAIVMVPEISLTPQTRGRFESRFDSVAVLHSQMSPSERHYHWQRIRRGEVQVVIGPRSAVFAPLPNLGLIVLDEEHDTSFKQDSQPRYHARKVAHARAMALGIPLLLGSATPSMEAWHASQCGHAELISMPNRVANRPMPDVQLVDLRIRDERGGSGAISRPLHAAVLETIRDKGQAILLLNRRGFATTIQCPSCGHVVACPDCDMPLTHHRDGGKAMCHYCDYTIGTPPWCPACRFDGIRYGGLGTQKLEMEAKAKFPNARIARMDSDTMKRPGSHQRVLSEFRNGDIDMLLGTQMIAKGLDFPNVLLVGVINADSALHFPDFRAAERTFQLVTQVAGRTGRGDRGGRVIVQTFTPEHPAIQAASRHDYHKFVEEEMVNRRKFNYPPLGSVARIIIRGPLEDKTEAVADGILARLESARDLLGSEVRILGPAPPPIGRLRGKYRFHLLLQATEAAVVGETIRRALADFKTDPKDEIEFLVDIDPVNLL
ncbi:replication restart DNA helicase PriA [Neorhodopirellula lusitana]|uniref:Replication restart protein PriA n=1 Tax=Neorhodopirellula lusitana TaxID=445327 RepID=A0ABY1PZC0_9BACT|nr:primosomal protein N' [Neorhodopirellula lusitana]SMP51898.1 replication restart DNA helicase PriA [Neorhodopirellula lusitana]